MNQRKLIEAIFRQLLPLADDDEIQDNIERFQPNQEVKECFEPEGFELWAARDEDGVLYFHRLRPNLGGEDGDRFWDSGVIMFHGRINEMPEITFENSPVKFRLVREEE